MTTDPAASDTQKDLARFVSDGSELIRVKPDGTVWVRDDAGSMTDTGLKMSTPLGEPTLEYGFHVMRLLGLYCAALQQQLDDQVHKGAQLVMEAIGEENALKHDIERGVQIATDLVNELEAERITLRDVREQAGKWLERADTADALQQRLATVEAEVVLLREVKAWAADMLVYLDIDFNDLPHAEFKIYEEGYDKTEAGLREAIRALNAPQQIAPTQKP